MSEYMNQTIEILNNMRIKPLIKKGLAQVIDASHCRAFNDYLCAQYPWIKYSDKIDWDEVKKPYKRFKWDNATVRETTNFLKKTCLANFKEVCIVYGANRPGLIIKFDYACSELENLVIFGWATRDLVGIKRDKHGNPHLVHECCVEIDFSDWLTAPC